MEVILACCAFPPSEATNESNRVRIIKSDTRSTCGNPMFPYFMGLRCILYWPFNHLPARALQGNAGLRGSLPTAGVIMDSIRFYFSFRSHYSWLGLHRIEQALAGLPVRLSTIPCFPPAGPEDEGTAEDSEERYIRDDIERFARAYGLTLRWPKPFDTDWIRPHTAFLWAQDQGRGPGREMPVELR